MDHENLAAVFAEAFAAAMKQNQLSATTKVNFDHLSNSEGLLTNFDDWILSYDIYMKASDIDKEDAEKKLNVLLHNVGPFVQRKYSTLPQLTPDEIKKRKCTNG